MKRIRSIVIVSIIIIAAIGCKKENLSPVTDDSLNSTVYSTVTTTTNVTYGSAITQGGVTMNLHMDIYQPQGDNSSNRPLIILAHGGGFLVGDKESMADLATFFAKSGYVVASLQYRLVDVEESPEVMIKGVIDAMHDMRAAVRFFRKDLATSNAYRIDQSNIFVGGYSAGAFMGLHTAYLTSDQELLELGGQPLLDYVNAQGGFDGNSGNPGYSSSVKGSISLAGALGKASFIDPGEPILYSFHGTADQVVPYYSGNSDGTGVITEGPGIYHPVADAAGITNRLYTVNNGAHDVFWDTEGSYEDLRAFISANLGN